MSQWPQKVGSSLVQLLWYCTGVLVSGICTLLKFFLATFYFYLTIFQAEVFTQGWQLSQSFKCGTPAGNVGSDTSLYLPICHCKSSIGRWVEGGSHVTSLQDRNFSCKILDNLVFYLDILLWRKALVTILCLKCISVQSNSVTVRLVDP